ncbi:MAG: helix-turn-helix transcriptional regulator [Planctomycetota bacterium]
MLTTEQVAELCSVSTRTVQRWVKRGWFCPPAICTPHVWRWFQADVDNWFREQARKRATRGIVRIA